VFKRVKDDAQRIVGGDAGSEGRWLSPAGGVCEQIATAITVRGICVISKASSGAMLDRGRWLSPLGVSVSRLFSPATSCKFLHLSANPFHSFCYVAVQLALSCLHYTHSGCLPSFFTQVLCCVLSSLGGTGDAVERSTLAD